MESREEHFPLRPPISTNVAYRSVAQVINSYLNEELYVYISRILITILNEGFFFNLPSYYLSLLRIKGNF
jgi:hypothetical protein